MVAVNNCMNKMINQCRLCGKYVRNWKNLFKTTIKIYQNTGGKRFSLKPVCDIIKECLNFNITENDNHQLPKSICSDCVNKLSSWQKFQKLCAKQQYIFSCLKTDNKDNNGYTSPTDCSNKDIKILTVSTVPSVVVQRSLTGREAYVNDTDTEPENVRVQNQTSNEDKLDSVIGIPIAETNEEISRFRISHKGRKKTKLAGQKELGIIVNIKRSRARVSRCMYCKTIFKTKEEQIFHRGSIQGCVFLCHKCPKEFQLKFSLRKHLETHEEQRKYCCHVCGSLFMTMACLKCHIQLHDRGSKEFKCSYCPKRFHQTNQLNQHLRIHTGEKPHACSECPRRFNQRFQLDRHIEGVHKKVKKHKCSTCGKTFLYNNNFKAHLMRHAGQKDMECNICQKSFVTKNALFRHQRFHTGEKPFPCPECGKLFADCSNRKRHVIQYHGNKCVKNIGKNLEKGKGVKSSNRESEILTDNVQENNDTLCDGRKLNTLRSFFESQESLLNDGKSEEGIDSIPADENGNNSIKSNDNNNEIHSSSSLQQNNTIAIMSNEQNDINSINGVLKNLENGELTVTVLNEQNGECLQLVTTEKLIHYENVLINNNTNSIATACSSDFSNVRNKLTFGVESNTGKQNGNGARRRDHQLNQVFHANNYTAIFNFSDSETVSVSSDKDVATSLPSNFGLMSDRFVSDTDLAETGSAEQHVFTLDTTNKIIPLDTLSIIKMLNTNGTILLAVPDNEDYITLPEVAVNN